MSLKDPLHEVECDTTEPVFMSNGNCFDISRHCEFQNPLETPPVEVDPTPNVCDDFKVGELGTEEFDLVFKISLLLSCGDASIYDRFPSIMLPGQKDGIITDELFDIVSTRTAWCSDTFDFLFVRVIPQS
jgi:hypothetical protein